MLGIGSRIFQHSASTPMSEWKSLVPIGRHRAGSIRPSCASNPSCSVVSNSSPRTSSMLTRATAVSDTQFPSSSRSMQVGPGSGVYTFVVRSSVLMTEPPCSCPETATGARIEVRPPGRGCEASGYFIRVETRRLAFCHPCTDSVWGAIHSRNTVGVYG